MPVVKHRLVFHRDLLGGTGLFLKKLSKFTAMFAFRKSDLTVSFGRVL